MKKVKDLSIKVRTLEDCLKAAKDYFGDIRHKRELEWFKSWVEAQTGLAAEGLEVCPKCYNDPDRTPGGCPCERCGAIGQQPWDG